MFVVFSWDVLQDKGKGVVTACDLKEALKAGGKLKGTSQTKLLFFLGPSCFCIPTYLAVDKFQRD